MAVELILSKTLGGQAAADALAGGGTGFQFGNSEAGQTPTTQHIYIRHDGANEIVNLAVYVRAYSQTYGGEYSASADHTKLVQQGLQGGGFQIDFNRTAPEFATFTTITAALGSEPANAILIPASCIFFDNSGSPVPASAPQQGKLGADGDSTLGDTAHLRCRWVVPNNEQQPGRRQVDLAFTYNFST